MQKLANGLFRLILQRNQSKVCSANFSTKLGKKSDFAKIGQISVYWGLILPAMIGADGGSTTVGWLQSEIFVRIHTDVMITAKEILTTDPSSFRLFPERSVNGDMPITDVLPRLLDAPGHILGVEENGACAGVIDCESLLRGMGRMIAARDDCSIITLECTPPDYSASRISQAVEDTDAHLVDMWTYPYDSDRIRVTLRVRRDDPSPVVHSLERYGYEVVDARGNENGDSDRAAMRLLELQTLLNV